MKLGKHIIAALVLFTFASISHAKDYTFTVDIDFYAGSGYSFMGYQLSNADSADLNIYYMQGGITFYDWVSIESRMGTGTSKGEGFHHTAGEDIEITLDSYYGVYLKVGCPHSAPFYVYGILGNSTIDSTVGIETINGYEKIKESNSGVSYGAGLDFNLSGLNGVPTWFNLLGFEFSRFNIPENIVLSAEYLQYLNNDNVKIGGLNLGAQYRF